MSRIQLLNLSTTTISAPKLSSSLDIPSSPYLNQKLYIQPHFQQQTFFSQPTNFPNGENNQSGRTAISVLSADVAAPALPTLFVLQKRQVVLEVEVITVVTVAPRVDKPDPVVVTVNVPPPTKTQISEGGWPIINPGSSAACWSNFACNSVCPNFQQNGWYAHCVDSGCSQCRCQIISSNMCTGVPWSNVTGTRNYGSYYGSANARLSRKIIFYILLLALTSVFLV
ncbi:hypothetical protein BY996DRAFT_7272432 [Phakopsora pachyrhizi]|uniref:Expressed protein n=1 Tax=Phakopsora pachyrhizi TaxID=170000 RepID=A0AAV0BLI6_PHAPC|nr:hypothetical protein BY996DRAFT_7272432 [Phakopsora pachyrhizi]CAH7686975.1 expressed protein [Phakopsora pachyrhizi]